MENRDLELLKIRSIVQVLFVFLGVLMIQVMSAALWNVVSAMVRYRTDESTKMMQMSVISAILIALWCGYLYYHSSWRVRPFDYRQAFTVKTIGSVLGIGMGGCIILTFLLSFLQSIFPQMFAAYNKVMNQFEEGEMLITFLYVLLLGPLTEELIFRGVMFDRLRLSYSFWVANLLQAAIFGAYHMRLIQGIYAFGCGILLGMLYQMTGSILTSILAHMIFNATNYLLGWLFPAGREVSVPMYIGIFLFGTVSFAVALWYTIRVCKCGGIIYENKNQDV